jgi:DNA-binding helix-hairpin-helix protein with protein kinase domain
MIFLMLFMGRHPFAGRYLGQGEMPISRAIRECRFPYGSSRASVQMEPPPGTPPLAIVGREVGLLFERAFARESVQGGRPEATDWVFALENLAKRTKQCSVHPISLVFVRIAIMPLVQNGGRDRRLFVPMDCAKSGDCA